MQTVRTTVFIATIIAAMLLSPRMGSSALNDKKSPATQPSATAKPQSAPASAPSKPVQLLRAGKDAKKCYYLISTAEKADPPADGYKLLIVLPGGDGSAEFNPFIKRIHENVLSDRWLIAELAAPKWNAKQEIVWPTEKLKSPGARFTTEEFIEAVLTDVKSRVKIESKSVFVLGWSSGGPACYAATLRKGSSIAGAFIAMSVFHPAQIPAIQNAKGKRFYLLHSPEDNVVPIRFAEQAQEALKTAGAEIKYDQYPGGHGWQGDVYGMMSAGIEWLDRVESKP